MATIGNAPLQAQVYSQAIFYGNGQSISTTFTLPAGQNTMAIGPITQSTGVVTISNGALWEVI